jgi:hypothetical protein
VKQIGTRSVPRQWTEIVKTEVKHVKDRSVDAWDIITFGIARLCRKNRIEWTELVETTVTHECVEQEPIYEAHYAHIIEHSVTQQRTVTWDFTSELPINYHDNFDLAKPGRQTRPWREVSREVIREWDEGL